MQLTSISKRERKNGHRGEAGVPDHHSQASSEVFFRLHLKVKPHLLFQFAVESTSPHVEETSAPEL
jgi:hypothetical protein